MTNHQPPTDASPRHPLPPGLIHDLRTPLNQIVGYSEMLVEQAQETGPEGLVPDLQRVRAAGQQLLTIINDNFQADGSADTAHAVVLGAGSGVLGAEALQPEGIGPLASTLKSSDTQTQVEAGGLRQGFAPHSTPIAPGKSEGYLLVVDDNEANRDVLSRRLESQGYTIATAENGRQALEMLRADFDLVLLDIMMPEMDGYEVLQRLKADDRLQHVPVIMISALSELESVARCIEMGADDYLPKPFNPTLLKARVSACLEKKRGHDREMHLFEEVQQNYKRLQELERLRDDLTHMIIHDLRTPLTSVISGMQSLEVVGDLNPDQNQVKDIAIMGGETLLAIINDLLDVDKLESGAMPLDYVLLSAVELIASAVRRVASLADGKQLKVVQNIQVDLPPLDGDEIILGRTLVNLLGNAIKFTPAGGTVTVEARHTGDGRSVEFSVSDTGEGIPREAFGRIFEKFGQVQIRKGGRKPGTGLGLTFCKLAVESHGGDIGLVSAPGEGSTFSFTIPLRAGKQ